MPAPNTLNLNEFSESSERILSQVGYSAMQPEHVWRSSTLIYSEVCFVHQIHQSHHHHYQTVHHLPHCIISPFPAVMYILCDALGSCHWLSVVENLPKQNCRSTPWCLDPPLFQKVEACGCQHDVAHIPWSSRELVNLDCFLIILLFLCPTSSGCLFRLVTITVGNITEK